MFKTITRFASSFTALLTDQRPSVDAQEQLEVIRAAMLDEIMELDDMHAVVYGSVWNSIDSARDIQSLWYLRSDLLKVISESYGEEVARKKLQEISEMFRGLVAKNQLAGNSRRKRL